MCQRSQNETLAVALEDFLSVPEACTFKLCMNCKLQGSGQLQTELL